jgi:hypothetical protein
VVGVSALGSAGVVASGAGRRFRRARAHSKPR